MKIDFAKSSIAVAISALLAYACHEICAYERVQWIVAIGAFLTTAAPALLAMGITARKERSATVLSILSGVLLAVEIAMNAAFAFFDFSIPAYVIANGLAMLAFASIYISIYRKRM